MIHEVDSSAALTKALKSAAAGDTILLAGGDYNTITLKDLAFAEGGVTIASKDPADRAVLSNVTLRNVEGLTFRDVEFDAKGAANTATVSVFGSRDIIFDDVYVHGSLDGIASNDASGLMIRDSVNVDVVNSEFEQLYWGLCHLDSQDVSITSNRFHGIRMDGVRGGGSSDVVVSENRFWNFQPEPGDHPDAIQFWTTNTTAAARHIVVENNVIERGEGAAFQGILISDRAGFPFEEVIVRGNIVVGGMYNGILVSSARDVTIADNVVQGFADMKSWVRVNAIEGFTLTNNGANTYLIAEDVRDLINLGNQVLAQATDGGAAVMLAWLTARFGGGDDPGPSPARPDDPTTFLDGLMPDLTGADLFGGNLF